VVAGVAGTQAGGAGTRDELRPPGREAGDLRGHGASGGDPAHCDIETYGPTPPPDGRR
jgi:hypothetical protein